MLSRAIGRYICARGNTDLLPTARNMTHRNMTHRNMTHRNMTHRNIMYKNITHKNITLLLLLLDEQARDATDRDGAALIPQGELPEDLHPLKRLHADALRHVDLDGDE